MKKKEILLILTLLILASLVYYRVTINKLNLTTGILFLVVVCVLGFFLSETSMRILRRSEKTKNKMRLLLITISILLVGMELILRFGLNRYSTYSERNGVENYISMYERSTLSWFNIYGANQEIKEVRPEFTYIRKINSLGLSEGEVDVEKEPNEYRVIALNDPGIVFIDLLDYYVVNHIMTENTSDFFWSIDAHYNTKGYEEMGRAIAHKIIDLRLID